MESPFPGMDPYLEAPDLCPDVHASLAYAIREQLQPLLGSRYRAALIPYVVMETIEIAPSRRIAPDVSVFERETPGVPRGGGTAIAPPSLIGRVAMEMPTRYHRVEIRAPRDEELVTAIEILSPVNKRPGVDAADAYERKRREVFNSDAHLLEIDFLRGGKRPSLLEPLPDDPYSILLSRADRRPEIEIWSLSLRESIPVVPVPLRHPDPDVALDLTAALARIYSVARYDFLLDYREPPPQPPLPEADAAWVEERLRERGLRP